MFLATISETRGGSLTISRSSLSFLVHSGASRARLGREAEMEDVAVLHHVVLAFEPELAGVARAGLARQRHVVVIGDGLGADEALLEIGVDHACGLRRACALGHGPGPRFLRASSEISD